MNHIKHFSRHKMGTLISCVTVAVIGSTWQLRGLHGNVNLVKLYIPPSSECCVHVYPVIAT